MILSGFIGSVQDPDFWWHVRTGRWILDNGLLPSHDLYTFTAIGHPWLDHEYLSESGMWLLFKSGGFGAISIAFGALTYAAFLLIFRTARGGSRPYVISGLAMALAAIAGSPIWGPRPQMITFFFVCLQLDWLRRYLEGRSRMINYFPLVLIVWANLHGGFVIAFAFFGIALAAEALAWIVERRNPAHRARLKTLSRVTLVSLAAVLATPHGLSVYLNPFETLTSTAQRANIVEWFSPNFHETFLLPYLAMILLLLVLFAVRRPTAYDLLLALSTLALSLESVRHVALFIAAVTPILIAQLSDVWLEVSERRGIRLPRADPSRLFATITVLALLVIAGATTVRVVNQLTDQQAQIQKQYPVGAADYLARHPELGTRMFNSYGWGGYLIYRFYPDQNRRVYAFGEASVLGDQVINNYQEIAVLRTDWAAQLQKDRVDYVVFGTQDSLSNVLLYLPGSWEKVYEDPVAVIFVRKGS